MADQVEAPRRGGPGCCFAVTVLGGATLVALYLGAPPDWRLWETPGVPATPGSAAPPAPSAGGPVAGGPVAGGPVAGGPVAGPGGAEPAAGTTDGGPASQPLPLGPVRVSLRGGGVLEGTLEREAEDGLVLRIPGQGKMTLPRARVIGVESLARGTALVQAAVAAADRGDDALARRLFEQALADEDPEVRGRARSQLDAWEARRQASPPPATPAGAPTPAAPPPRPARGAPSGDAERLAALQARATVLATGVHWRGGQVRGPVQPALGLPCDVYQVEVPAGRTLGVIALTEPPLSDPQLQLYDARGRVVAGEQGLAEGLGSLVAAPGGGTCYLVLGAAEGQKYRLLAAWVTDVAAYDCSRRLRDGSQEAAQFTPDTPELEGRPVRFWSFELRPGQRADVWARGGETRLFTGSGIPLPDGRALYAGTYHVAVLAPGPVERRTELTVGLQVARER